MHGQAGAARRDTPAAEVRDQPLANQEPGMRKQQGQHGATLQRDPAAVDRDHSVANQEPGMRKQPRCSVRFGRAEPERPGWATEQAEPSMQATELSLSGPSAQFAWFDYRPGLSVYAGLVYSS